jgi:hypothetical protein
MRLEDVTLALFAACNFIRVFAYIPQIHKAATDVNGASAISCTTWALFLVAHVSTVAYALVNRSDWWLAACFASNALCCIAILAIAYWKGQCHAREKSRADASRHRTVSGQPQAFRQCPGRIAGEVRSGDSAQRMEDFAADDALGLAGPGDRHRPARW